MTAHIVKDYMTKFPHTIGVNQRLPKAKEMMREFDVRHLPVLEAGQLVGIISDRDVNFAESIPSVDTEKLAIEEVYTPDPYQVAADANLIEVCQNMIDKKIGCALITEQGNLMGIFTWIDALKAFVKLNS